MKKIVTILGVLLTISLNAMENNALQAPRQVSNDTLVKQVLGLGYDCLIASAAVCQSGNDDTWLPQDIRELGGKKFMVIGHYVAQQKKRFWDTSRYIAAGLVVQGFFHPAPNTEHNTYRVHFVATTPVGSLTLLDGIQDRSGCDSLLSSIVKLLNKKNIFVAQCSHSSFEPSSNEPICTYYTQEAFGNEVQTQYYMPDIVAGWLGHSTSLHRDTLLKSCIEVLPTTVTEFLSNTYAEIARGSGDGKN